VLGAGGAARALIDGLRRRGAKVTIFNRTKSRAAELAKHFGVRHLPWHRARRFPCDLLVNATPVGMASDIGRSPVPSTWVAAPLVYDMIYNPLETRFLRLARQRGATVIGGLDMFLAQGARQFGLFTGRRAPLPVMRRAVLEALGVDDGPAPGGRTRPAAAPQRAARRREEGGSPRKERRAGR
jgi:3-dehydroquinate dehydratase/shikimate dehydrogenase